MRMYNSKIVSVNEPQIPSMIISDVTKVIIFENCNHAYHLPISKAPQRHR